MSNTISSQATSMSNTQVSEISPVNKTQATGGQGPKPAFPDSSQSQPSKKEAEALVNSLNDFLKPHQTSIRCKLYEKLNVYYIQVIDDKTKSVIIEIPSKKLLDDYSAMMEHVGIMFDKKI